MGGLEGVSRSRGSRSLCECVRGSLVEIHHYDEALKTLDEAIKTATTPRGVAYGYKVALPITAHHTAREWILEGHAIQPDIEVLFDPALARDGRDSQLDQALATVRQL